MQHSKYKLTQLTVIVVVVVVVATDVCVRVIKHCKNMKYIIE